ncbi:MAG: glucose-1-phosphate cytidylyltransferase [Candidatus Acidiferrales bacterium]
MRVVILAGGIGSRLAEQTELKPKPLVEIGGHPILWHILKHYAFYDHREFFIALGYRGDDIKRYFVERTSLNGDITLRPARNQLRRHGGDFEDWTLHMIDTGEDTNTGGRVKRLEEELHDQPFLLTYGDGVSNLDLKSLVEFHKSCGRLATVTAVRPPARFGGLIFDGDLVVKFTEKPQIGEGWINGGFLVFEPGVFKYLANDNTSLESDALERLAAEGQLAAYKHEGFWQCMDTLREKRLLESLWLTGNPPWKMWDQS